MLSNERKVGVVLFDTTCNFKYTSTLSSMDSGSTLLLLFTPTLIYRYCLKRVDLSNWSGCGDLLTNWTNTDVSFMLLTVGLFQHPTHIGQGLYLSLNWQKSNCIGK